MNKYEPENKVKTKVKNFLTKRVPGKFFHYSAYHGVAGVPDQIGVQDGRFIGIELKKRPMTPDVRPVEPTPVQKNMHKLLIESGAVVIVINEHDPIAQLKREFDRHCIKYNV